MAAKTDPYDIGDEVVFYVDFTDTAGAAANPTTVTLKVMKPDGTTNTYTGGTVSNPTVGRFEKPVVLDQEGRWWYRFEGTGAVAISAERYVQVRDSRFQ